MDGPLTVYWHRLVREIIYDIQHHFYLRQLFSRVSIWASNIIARPIDLSKVSRPIELGNIM